jgi:small-conductance mechanosensitive channel
MKADLICFAWLSGFELSQFIPFLRLPQHLMDAYGPWIWAVYCGILFLLYPLIQVSRFQSHVTRFLGQLGRLLAVFFCSVSFWILIDLWLRPIDRGEWALGAFFTIVPALFVGLPAFTVGYLARHYYTHVA